MERRAIQKIIETSLAEQKYCSIYTNIPAGRGINGISFVVFCLNAPKPLSEHKAYVTIDDIIFHEEYLEIIARDTRGNKASNYLDYNSVTQITTYDKREHNYHLRGIS